MHDTTPNGRRGTKLRKFPMTGLSAADFAHSAVNFG